MKHSKHHADEQAQAEQTMMEDHEAPPLADIPVATSPAATAATAAAPITLSPEDVVDIANLCRHAKTLSGDSAAIAARVLSRIRQ